MKRRAKKDEELWEDPNQLTIPRLQEPLKSFGIQFDPTERRGLLFQRYVQLARVESPQSVELWTGQDSLDAPLPAANRLTIPQIKIFLALRSVDFPAQVKRGHLVKLYIDDVLSPGGRVENNAVPVVIPTGKRPSHSDQKKRKTNPSHQKRPPQTAPSPLPAPNASPDPPSRPSQAGKIRRTKTQDRKETFFSPFRRSARLSSQPTGSTRSLAAPSTSRMAGSPAGPSEGRSLSRSSEGSFLRQSTRLRASREARTRSQSSPSVDRESESQVSIKDESDSENSVRLCEYDSQMTRSSAGPSQGRSLSRSSEGYFLRQSPRLRASREAHTRSQSSRSVDRESESQVSIKDESDAENSVRLREYDHHGESSEPPAAADSSSRSQSSADSHNMSREVDPPSSPGTSFAASPSPFDTAPTPPPDSPTDAMASHESPTSVSYSRDSSARSESVPGDRDHVSFDNSSVSTDHDSQASSAREVQLEIGEESRSSQCHEPLQEDRATSSSQPTPSSHQEGSPTPSSHQEGSTTSSPKEASPSPSNHREGSPTPTSVSYSRDSSARSELDIGEESRSSHEPLQEDRATSSSQPTPSSHQEGSPSPSSHREGSPTPSSHNITGTSGDRARSSSPARSGKRKSEAPSHWPHPSELSREEIEAYLTVHGVAYNGHTRMARLIAHYNILRSSEQPPPSKRSKAPRSSPGPHARQPASSDRRQRRSRTRVQASSNDGSDQEYGFVYRPAQPPRNTSVSPPSSASSSNYQPSVAYTENTEQSAVTLLGSDSRSALGSGSGRRNSRSPPIGSGRRNSTSPPIEKHRGKRAKPTPETKRPAQRRPPAKKSQPRGRRGWRRPQAHDLDNDGINFVPALPETSKKRRRAEDLSPKSNRAKQSRKAPTRSPATRRRRQSTDPQDSYRVQPSFHDNNQLEAPRPSPPPNHQHSFTSSGCRQEPDRLREDSYMPPSFHNDHEQEPALAIVAPEGSTSRSLRLDTDTARPSSDDYGVHTQTSPCPHSHRNVRNVHFPEALRAKRKQPDNLSPSRESGKRRAIPTDHSSPSRASVERRAIPATAPRLIPTSAQVRHRRQRQERPRRNSLIVRPSFHDDEVFLPNRPSSPSGPRGRVRSWRSSVPRGSSPPPSSPPPQSHHHPRTGPMAQCPCINHDHIPPGPTAGCSCIGVGQNMLSVFTQATDRLADCLEMAQTASLRPSTSQVPMSTPRPSGNRDLALLRRVRTHIMTLFGKTMELHQFPPPATQAERAKWNRDQQYNPDDGSDDEDRSSSSSSSDDDGDPHFPYPDGPGHKKASATTLRVMWRSMRQAGVVSFRPNLSRGAKHVDNLFLWDLAHTIFMKLVRAQEYRDVDLENTPEEKIRETILNHAKQLQRTYREAGWDPERLDEQCIKKRRTARTRRLRETRVKFLSTQAGLIPLIPVITQCTSDAETEPGGQEDSDADSDSERPPKRVVVERLPWRHPRIEKAVKLLDRLIEEKRESGCKDYGKRAHERIRPPQPQISTRQAPKSLSSDVYCEDWLRNQRMHLLDSLNIQGTSLGRAIKNLEKMQ